MYNPRNQSTDFIDQLQVMWAQNISKLGDVVVMAHELMKETHKRVRADPRNFIEMTGAIRSDQINEEALMRLATIAETLVELEERNIRYIPLLIRYRANVDVLFVRYFRTVLESILAVFLGDDKAKQYADRASKVKFKPEMMG